MAVCREQPRASGALLGGGVGAEVVDAGPAGHRRQHVVADHGQPLRERVGLGLLERLVAAHGRDDQGEAQARDDERDEDEQELDEDEQDLADGHGEIGRRTNGSTHQDTSVQDSRSETLRRTRKAESRLQRI